jgi:hypothetical protein
VSNITVVISLQRIAAAITRGAGEVLLDEGAVSTGKIGPMHSVERMWRFSIRELDLDLDSPRWTRIVPRPIACELLGGRSAHLCTDRAQCCAMRRRCAAMRAAQARRRDVVCCARYHAQRMGRPRRSRIRDSCLNPTHRHNDFAKHH